MPVPEDTAQTKSPAPPDLDARLAAFRDDPRDRKVHAELAGALRQAGRVRDLVDIDERYAVHEPDPGRAAAILCEAGKALLSLSEPERAEKVLGRALDRDAAHPDAVAALVAIYADAGRHAEAAEVLEDELAALRDRADAAPASQRAALTARRAECHRRLAELWQRHLGRVDRALEHWQRAWHLEPTRTDALEAARAIYASLGDDAMVARLYEAELELLGERGPKPRRAELELALGKIVARRGDVESAAQHLEAALALAPDADPAREALAEVYTSGVFADQAEYRRRAAQRLRELGQARLAQVHDTAPLDAPTGAGPQGSRPDRGSGGRAASADEVAAGLQGGPQGGPQGEIDAAAEFDLEEAGITYLRRALGLDPDDDETAQALTEALREAERWDELDRLYEHRLARIDEPARRVPYLLERATLYAEYLNDRATQRAILSELAAAGPAHGEHSRRLSEFLRAQEDWAALAAQIEAELPALAGDRGRTVAEMLELATIVREHLGDRDRAAAILHHILLEIDPGNQEALARYGDHFRERRDWRGLADLLDFSIDNAHKAGADPGVLARQLEEVAEICEQRMGDIDRAIHTWRRIQELEPSSDKPAQAIRRLESRAKMWASLVGVLEQEAQAAQSPAQRAEALRRIAQVYRERQVNPRRAIALYEEVAGIFPDDHGVLKALAELYEREGDDKGLAATLRRQLDVDARQVAAQSGQASEGGAPGVRDWPVAKRVERLTSLRRLASMYEQLDDTEGVVYATTNLLDLLPGDRDALERGE
uniref:hypothetical protein n=1 Tax=Haliangium sp. TaxID=2663208 RepID=UPI003D0CBE11